MSVIRVLLLTTDRTGAGHMAVSEALVQGAEARGGDFAIQALDVFAPDAPTWRDRLTHLYELAIVRWPWLWSAIFSLTDGPQGALIYRAAAGQSLVRRVIAAAEAGPPDVMVSVHPLLGHAAIEARRQVARLAHVPMITVITELVDVHRLWVADGGDYYIVGTEAAAAALAGRGVPPQRLARLGLPLRPAFGRLDRSGREMRRHLDLDPDLPLVLLMGGGAGAGDLGRRVQAMAELTRQGHRFQLVVVTGRNVRARLALEGTSWPLPMRVYGHVDNVAELMVAADVIATKPGSVTVSEALALGRPLVLSRPVGQEHGNIPYIVRGRAGFYAPSHEEAAEAIALLLQEPTIRWEMGLQASRLGQPTATRRTLDLIQSMALETAPPADAEAGDSGER